NEIDSGVCIPDDGGLELCDELDNDCDGLVDEGFDLETDIFNCGGCGSECIIANANVACVSAKCAVSSCLEGFEDVRSSEEGCEYRCPVFPVLAEDCNGVDDDCDGLIDEAKDLPAPPTDLCRTTANTPCAGTTTVCTERGGTTTWYCNYDEAVEFEELIPNGIALEETLCDGFDGDCDGVVDDSFEGLGDECDNGELGACRDVGAIVCSNDQRATQCDLSLPPDAVVGAPGPEICNSIDDDCDGIVDNSDPADPARIIDDMVRVDHSGLDFYIYAYEASRPGATASDAGVSTSRACSQPGVLPWTTLGYSAAASACANAGHRLCTAAEWSAACSGAGTTTYPYGNSYQANICNGADFDSIPGAMVDHITSETGGFAGCVSDSGAFDLSGNVKEWTDDSRGTTSNGTPIYVIRGGSHESPELGLSCATDLSRATEDTALSTLGFRCCSDSAP
ncbi:MAG: SUMF1/EgtB/PvdO family nonheme iron enzyme, partial [Myxococcota bacterium]